MAIDDRFAPVRKFGEAKLNATTVAIRNINRPRTSPSNTALRERDRKSSLLRANLGLTRPQRQGRFPKRSFPLKQNSVPSLMMAA